MTPEQVFENLQVTKMSALVISGGEPFLQQKQLVPLLRLLTHANWWVEVETNGTIAPRPEFRDLVNQINCSPKLANALDPIRLRRRDGALKVLSLDNKVNFKFVIQTQEDLTEVLELVETYKFREVRLMPECRTKEELLAKEDWLKKICETHGFIYCTRLSILQSGTKRGV